MIEFDPLANIFPLIEGADFDALIADIKAHGLADKIVMHVGKILDGRNRYRALVRIGLTDEEILRTHTEPLEEDTDPLAFVISKNLKRRHLDESQRAMVAARLATLTHGGDRVSEQAANLPVATQAEAATLLNVSERSVRSATIVRDCGAAELVAAVDRGDTSVSAAAVVATQPIEQQLKLVAAGEKEIIAAASKIRTEKRERKAKARAADTESADAPPQPPEPILSVDADFESVERGIDILYSRWVLLVRRVIEETDSISTIKNVHDMAAGLEARHHHAHNVDAKSICREIRLRAARKGGQLLIDLAKTGLRFLGRPPKGVKVGTPSEKDMLKKWGIERKQSHRWQTIAKLSEAEFAALIAGKPARRHLPHRGRRVQRLRPRRSGQDQADAPIERATPIEEEISPAA